MVVGWAPWWTGQTEWTSLLTVGVEMRQGTIIDAALIAAPSSTNNKA
jgi:hypothetical protein